MAAMLLAMVATAATADPVVIANPSFELPATPPDSFIVGFPPDGWSGYGTLNMSDRVIGVVNPATTPLYVEPVPDGSNIGVTFLQNFSGSEAGMQQTLGATLQLNTRYTLRVEVGNMAHFAGPPDFGFGGFPGYRIELLAGGVVVASDPNTLLPGEGRFLTSTVELEVGDSHPQAGALLGIRLVNLDAALGVEVNFDDVRLDADSMDCPNLPPTGCKAASVRRSTLSMAIGTSPTRNNAAWAWKGAATNLGELGTPTSTSSYLFCVYDGDGERVMRLRAAAGGTCGTKDCWKGSSTGFRYTNAAGFPGGLASLQLQAGDDGRASIKLKARGDELDVPALPLLLVPAPVRAFLVNEENGTCWEAAYDSVLGDPLSTSKWKARND